MLWQRVLTALALLPPVLAAIFLLPNYALAICFSGLAGLAAWEWAGLASITKPASKFSYAFVCVGLMVLASVVLPLSVKIGLWVLALLWWALGLLWIFRYPVGFEAGKPSQLTVSVIGLLVFPSALSAIAHLHSVTKQGPILLLTFFVLIWAMDVGAYFSGKSFGKNKLAPKVSPGKTWEGFVGGLILAIIVGVTGGKYFLFGDAALHWTWWLTVASIPALSVIGDLCESLLKRQAGVKDSGNILPGHGGVLDRIDSILAAAPIMAVATIFLLK